MKSEEKKKLMDDDLEGLPEIPDDFLQMVTEARANHNMIWYRKKGSKAYCICAQCGESYDFRFAGRWKDGEEPVKDNEGVCRSCNTHGWYRPLGKTQNIFTVAEYYLWQRQGGALICRMFREDRSRTPRIRQRIDFREYGRAYYEPHKVRMYSYNEWSNRWMMGKDYNKAIHWSGPTYGSPEELCEGTLMGYWKMKDWQKLVDRYHDFLPNVFDYMDMYARMCERPEIEMLAKSGLTILAQNIARNNTHCRLNYRAKNPAAFLRVFPDRLKQLRDKKGRDSVLRIYQAEKKIGTRFSEGLIENIITFYGSYDWNLKNNWNNFEEVCKYMSLQQAYNRVEDYYRGQKKKEWTKREDVLREYRDYLNMRAENGYDMTNSVYLHPKNLKKAHNEMVKEQEERKSQERIQKTEKMYPKIRSKYRNLNKKWHYEGHGMIIRPARSAGEIVVEGQLMHHCVGRDTYLQKHNTGKSFIFLLRKKGAEDIPYVTIEIDKNGIVQWYCAHDRKTEDKATLAALQEFESKIKGNVAPREKVAV